MCQYKSICNPIIELTTLLQSCGFTIEKQELKAWHFNEFEIVMKGKKLQLPMIDIEGIEPVSYTHLDVYKRQAITTMMAIGLLCSV